MKEPGFYSMGLNDASCMSSVIIRIVKINFYFVILWHLIPPYTLHKELFHLQIKQVRVSPHAVYPQNVVSKFIKGKVAWYYPVPLFYVQDGKRFILFYGQNRMALFALLLRNCP